MRQILGDGNVLTNSNSMAERVLVSDFVKNNTVIGLYFATHSSPYVHQFTLKLVDIYRRILSSNRDPILSFDIIYVWLFDSDKDSFNEHYREMPWKAIPYREEHSIFLIKRLDDYFNVQKVPTLIILNALNGEVITKNGYQIINELGSNAIESWCRGEKAIRPWLPDEKFVWYYVSCDGGCNMYPLTGLRYQCKICENYDLCAACKQSKGHEHELHLLPPSAEDDEEN